MSTVPITAWLCDFSSCGHVWYSAKEPARCAKCKRKNWNKIKGEVIPPPTKKKRVKAKKVPLTTAVQPTPIAPEIVEAKTEETPTMISGEPIPEIIQEPVIEYPIIDTVVNRPTADKYREILKQLSSPAHKIGEKCPHGWANWMQCPKCNTK